MNPILAATAYAIAGASAPFALVLRIAPLLFLVRCLGAWVLTSLILFYVDDPLTVLALAGLVLAVLMPSYPLQKIGFFFVTSACLPIYLEAYLPFPGINWLIMLTYYKVLVLVVITPLMFRLAPNEGIAGSRSIADVCVVLYVLFSVVMVTVSMGPTAGPRFLIDQMIVLAMPYFVLSLLVRSREDMDFCLRAIFLGSLILASLAIVATLKQWDFFRVKEPPSVFLIPDIRSGLIRIATTLNTHSLGYHLAVGVMVLEYLKKSMNIGFIRLWLFRGMLLLGLFATGSRGAMLGLAVAFGVYTIIMIRTPSVRWGMLLSSAFAIVAAGIWLVTTDDASSVDAYNSVGYRQLLLEISIQHILENPIVGDLNFLSDPSFVVLRQGQGIIDITNFYLQIGLSFGLIGLVLMAGVFAPTMRRLFGLIGEWNMGKGTDTDDVRRITAIILASLIGWFLLLATTSDVGLTFHLGLILIALGRAITRFEPAAARDAEKPATRPTLRTGWGLPRPSP